jgi:glucose 1-dehydrogenase
VKAIAVVPQTRNARLVDRPEPSISGPNQVKLQVIRVGICGTDREEAGGGRSRAPEGATELVIGHEMMGRVVETGQDVKRVRPGDYAVFTVRRGCGACVPCEMLRPDMCRTGNYRERGIWGLDGYQAQYVVDEEQWIVRVAEELADVGVLVEPTSVVEKAIDEAVRVQFARLPDAQANPAWLHGRRCLVAGLGPIGLLAALVLRLRGADVYGLDRVDKDTARPQWLTHIGGTYVDGKQVAVDRIDDTLGGMDLIVEAAGVASLAFNLLDALALDGICVLTGVPGDKRPLQIPGGDLVRNLVLGNRLMFGSVNAAPDHFQMAVDDLYAAHLEWGSHVKKLITHRHPYTDFDTAFTRHEDDEIKTVVEWCQ